MRVLNSPGMAGRTEGEEGVKVKEDRSQEEEEEGEEEVKVLLWAPVPPRSLPRAPGCRGSSGDPVLILRGSSSAGEATAQAPSQEQWGLRCQEQGHGGCGGSRLSAAQARAPVAGSPAGPGPGGG